MPKRSNDFQKLVFIIHKSLNTTGNVIESALLQDKVTDQEREVDILLSSSVATYPINIAIEVIDRSRKADVSWVEQMRSKHLNLPTDKLILVSRSGFYEPALRKAEFYGIETATIQEALETDWDLGVRMLSEGFLEIITYSFKCSALCSSLSGEKLFKSVPIKTSIYSLGEVEQTNFEEVFLSLLREPSIKEVMFKHAEETGEKGFIFQFDPPSSTFVTDESNLKMALLRVDISFEMLKKITPMQFAVGRYKNEAFSFATSSDSTQNLCFALLKSKDKTKADRAIVYDDSGIKEIMLD